MCHKIIKAAIPLRGVHGACGQIMYTPLGMIPQMTLFIFCPAVFGSEDCLYLNVYSPKLQPQKLLPVIVFIHGGGYRNIIFTIFHWQKFSVLLLVCKIRMSYFCPYNVLSKALNRLGLHPWWRLKEHQIHNLSVRVKCSVLCFDDKSIGMW